jgi:hypothetical protein
VRSRLIANLPQLIPASFVARKKECDSVVDDTHANPEEAKHQNASDRDPERRAQLGAPELGTNSVEVADEILPKCERVCWRRVRSSQDSQFAC